jgi:hypothetical protein
VNRRPGIRNNRGRIPIGAASGFDYRTVPGLLADITADAVTQAGTVSAFIDQFSTHDCTQGTPASQATYEATGWVDGTPSALFDGVDDYASSNTLAQLLASGTDQPYVVFLVAQLVATGASGDAFWACGSSSSITPIVRLSEAGANTIHGFRRDDAGLNPASPAYASFDLLPHVITDIFDGTTRTIQVDNVTVASGDQGTGTGALTVDRFALGALLRSTPGSYCNYRFKHLLPYSGVMSAGNISAIAVDLATRHGL